MDEALRKSPLFRVILKLFFSEKAFFIKTGPNPMLQMGYNFVPTYTAVKRFIIEGLSPCRGRSLRRGTPSFFFFRCITACGREHQIVPFMEGHTILLLEMMAEAFMLYKSTGQTKRHTPLRMFAPNQTSSTCDWVPAPRFMAAASSENKHGFWICSQTRFELFSTFNAQIWE